MNTMRLMRVASAVVMSVMLWPGLSRAEHHEETVAPAKLAVEDRFHPLPPGAVRLKGVIPDITLRMAEYSADEKVLAGMANIFRTRPHKLVNGRAAGLAEGEFWGKVVRSLCHAYEFSGDPRLRSALEATVADVMSIQTPDGCISDTVTELQPYHSDLWDRKYILLGLINAYEALGDPKVLMSAMRLADHTLTLVGPPPKVPIVKAGYFCIPGKPLSNSMLVCSNMDACSILEPFVRLYQLTGKPAYLEFAKYIVEVEGCSSCGRVFDEALAGKDAVSFNKGYGAHMYTTISCFEGVVEYYRVTGNARWIDAANKFCANVAAKEITVIGSGSGYGPVIKSGATEKFNHTGLYQTCPACLGMEGCSSGRWGAFLRQLHLISGDPLLMDEFERTLYNALLGSIRPDAKMVDYFTRLDGCRPTPMGFSRKFDNKIFTCCYPNVVDTMALTPFTAVLSGEGGAVVNLYIPGTATVKLSDGNEVTLEQTTEYPKTGEVEIAVRPAKPAHFPIRLRIPQWSKQTRVMVNGKEQEAKAGSYLVLDRDWTDGDKITLNFDMRCRLVRSPEGSPASADHFRALVRGPVVLARDKRLGGDIHEEVAIVADQDGYVQLTPQTPAFPAMMQFAVPTRGGGSFPVIDFATSGNTWDKESERVTWIPQHQAAK